jgi:hypothetical protein
MFNLKRLKIFEIGNVMLFEHGVYISDTADNTFYISREREGNVPLNGIYEEGRIWLICDKDGEVLRWKFKCAMFDEWDF